MDFKVFDAIDWFVLELIVFFSSLAFYVIRCVDVKLN